MQLPQLPDVSLTNPTVQQMNRSINPFLNCGYCLIGSCAAQNRQQNAAQKRMDKAWPERETSEDRGEAVIVFVTPRKILMTTD
jgi:hypothetical protein